MLVSLTSAKILSEPLCGRKRAQLEAWLWLLKGIPLRDLTVFVSLQYKAVQVLGGPKNDKG